LAPDAAIDHFVRRRGLVHLEHLQFERVLVLLHEAA